MNNRKTKQATSSTSGAESSNLGESAARICEGMNLIVNELVRRLAPPAEVRQHFDNARIEVLKGLRAMMDARIAQIEKTAGRKGQKIDVE